MGKNVEKNSGSSRMQQKKNTSSDNENKRVDDGRYIRKFKAKTRNKENEDQVQPSDCGDEQDFQKKEKRIPHKCEEIASSRKATKHDRHHRVYHKHSRDHSTHSPKYKIKMTSKSDDNSNPSNEDNDESSEVYQKKKRGHRPPHRRLHNDDDDGSHRHYHYKKQYEKRMYKKRNHRRKSYDTSETTLNSSDENDIRKYSHKFGASPSESSSSIEVVRLRRVKHKRHNDRYDKGHCRPSRRYKKKRRSSSSSDDDYTDSSDSHDSRAYRKHRTRNHSKKEGKTVDSGTKLREGHRHHREPPRHKNHEKVNRDESIQHHERKAKDNEGNNDTLDDLPQIINASRYLESKPVSVISRDAPTSRIYKDNNRYDPKIPTIRFQVIKRLTKRAAHVIKVVGDIMELGGCRTSEKCPTLLLDPDDKGYEDFYQSRYIPIDSVKPGKSIKYKYFVWDEGDDNDVKMGQLHEEEFFSNESGWRTFVLPDPNKSGCTKYTLSDEKFGTMSLGKAKPSSEISNLSSENDL